MMALQPLTLASAAPALLLVLLLLASAPQSGSGLRRLQQSSAVRSNKRTIAQPDYNIYHRKKDLLNKVADIVAANPTTMKVGSRQR